MTARKKQIVYSQLQRKRRGIKLVKSFTLSPEAIDALEETADRLGVSMAEVVQRAVKAYHSSMSRELPPEPIRSVLEEFDKLRERVAKLGT